MTVKMYIITENDYILKRTSEGVSEYFYCSVYKNATRSSFTKGKPNSDNVVFSKEDFYFQTSFEELEKYECRILG
jgi:hypothetical protein